MKKKYSKKKALDSEDYPGLVKALPVEVRPQMAQAIAGAIDLIHGDPRITQDILQKVHSAEDPGSEVAKTALTLIDLLSESVEMNDSVKLLVGFVLTRELVELVNKVTDLKISDEETVELFETALTVYMHEQIANQPTQEAREATAIKLQQDVEPLVPPEARKQGHKDAQRLGMS